MKKEKSELGSEKESVVMFSKRYFNIDESKDSLGPRLQGVCVSESRCYNESCLFTPKTVNKGKDIHLP